MSIGKQIPNHGFYILSSAFIIILTENSRPTIFDFQNLQRTRVLYLENQVYTNIARDREYIGKWAGGSFKLVLNYTEYRRNGGKYARTPSSLRVVISSQTRCDVTRNEFKRIFPALLLNESSSQKRLSKISERSAVVSFYQVSSGKRTGDVECLFGIIGTNGYI